MTFLCIARRRAVFLCKNCRAGICTQRCLTFSPVSSVLRGRCRMQYSPASSYSHQIPRSFTQASDFIIVINILKELIYYIQTFYKWRNKEMSFYFGTMNIARRRASIAEGWEENVRLLLLLSILGLIDLIRGWNRCESSKCKKKYFSFLFQFLSFVRMNTED